MDKSIVMMKWNKEQGHYDYFICNPPAKKVSHKRDIQVVMLSQFLPRPDAAKMLGYTDVIGLP
jgi:hypothetical protein